MGSNKVSNLETLISAAQVMAKWNKRRIQSAPTRAQLNILTIPQLEALVEHLVPGLGYVRGMHDGVYFYVRECSNCFRIDLGKIGEYFLWKSVVGIFKDELFERSVLDGR